ncbi:transglutaminase domain-containing protein [Flavobacterium selenitireducens]|uniref:transglutaminase domain-containing protein n=1 Tax=Flavobacterium selenitireducens TaxID=2722704 RepID=UPI00168AA8A0|nr:transglutaminase domain-containing protein [Flavobacterium selenitireducens]MBD3581996.1 transglutaminase domain-containing protein [Flavobacterium selenitireducens]
MKVLFTALLILAVSVGFGQKKIKSIDATVAAVDIREGAKFRKNAWRISPEVTPDVFTTSSDKVTFYTDRDSITVKVDRKKPIDFIIKFDGKDALTRIAYEPSFLDKLRAAKTYDLKEKAQLPKFSYQSKDDAYLVTLRNKFKLDSIAGEGNQTSRILNLMHWMHNTVRHDGSSPNPESRNANDLIAICKNENRGVNCRMMAIALNECYLALGIKSKFVTCMPKEENFDDCHVINMVFNTDLNRWIWVDPTFAAYVMDEKGELLGIAEVRERLISGKTLILNPDANWNREESQTADYYLQTYMAKNLYRIQVPVSSQADFETWKDGQQAQYVELLPLDGIWQTKAKTVYQRDEPKMEFVYYQTNNPDAFWAKPE